MGCRCRDIPRCSRDIERIEDILSLFKDTEVTNVSVSSELNGLANQSMATFFSKDMFELEAEEKKLNKTLTDLLPDMINECEGKISDLKNKLSSMKSEDKRYHEEQRHKHHHHDKK